jgi:hypothetical protein
MNTKDQLWILFVIRRFVIGRVNSPNNLIQLLYV